MSSSHEVSVSDSYLSKTEKKCFFKCPSSLLVGDGLLRVVCIKIKQLSTLKIRK